MVKLDADISFANDYFERLLASFDDDPRLGIASGTCFEQRDGEWCERHVTADHVWGACRAYRAACLEQVSPLEERMGWDGIDVLKANARGWRTGDRPGTRLPPSSRRGQPRRRPVRAVARPRSGCALHGLPPVLRAVSRAPPRAPGSRCADDDPRLAEAGPQARADLRRRDGTEPISAASSAYVSCRCGHAKRTESDPDD